jgi:hypothetical protein
VLLTKFLKASPLKSINIGGEVFHARTWSLNDRRIFNHAIAELRDDEHRDEHAVKLLLATSLCDEQGERSYPDWQSIEVEQIPDDVLEQLIDHVRAVQGMVVLPAETEADAPNA